MLDSLDLNRLKSDIAADKKAARRIWMIGVAVIFGFITVIFLMVALVSGPTQSGKSCSKCSAIVIQLLIAVLPLFSIIVLGASFYLILRRRRNYAKRARQNLPVLALPPVIKSHENKISIIMFVLLIAISLIFKLDFPSVILLFVLAFAIPLEIISFAGIWARAPIFKTNYDEALRRIHILERWLNGNPGVLILESITLIFAGDTTESERVHLQFVAQAQHVKVYDWIAYNNYGVELTYQGRYEEALPLLEAAIRLQPQIGNAYDSLAHWYLSQNASSERALELADFGLQLQTTFTIALRGNSKSLRLATRAWAESRSGKKEAARLTIADAMQSSGSRHIPVLAETHRLAGETYIALGDTDKAREHFQKSAELDSNGRIGKLAQAALEKLPAFGNTATNDG